MEEPQRFEASFAQLQHIQAEDVTDGMAVKKAVMAIMTGYGIEADEKRDWVLTLRQLDQDVLERLNPRILSLALILKHRDGGLGNLRDFDPGNGETFGNNDKADIIRYVRYLDSQDV